MKKILQYLAILFVSVGALIILFSFFTSAKAVDEISILREDLLEQKAIWNHYAPIAKHGKIAERHLTVANLRANIIREELKLLEGNLTTGAK